VLVQNTSTGGSLRVSLACDTGAAVALAPVAVTLGPGAAATVPGFDPAGCLEAVAVVTNESQTAPNPDSSAAQTYTVSTVEAPATTKPVVPPAGAGSAAGATTDRLNALPPPALDTPSKAKVSRLVFGRAIVRRNGTVRIRARVSGSGVLKATARARARPRGRRLTVARRTIRPRRAGIVTLRLKAGPRARRMIRANKGRLRAKTTLLFTPTTGARRTKSKTVTFRLKR